MILTALVALSVAGGVPTDTVPDVLQPPAPVPALVALPRIGDRSESRLRTEQLLGLAGTHSFLLRSPSSGLADFAQPGWSGLAPTLELIHNSEIPNSLNEGNLWAGRGIGMRAGMGFVASVRPVTVVLFPEVIHEENRGFQIFHFPEAIGQERLRSPFASPFHYPPSSMDLPLRPGERSRTRVSPGQSSITVKAGPLAVGWATENQWWGPGVRNALVMSNNAPGIPHLFVRTARPLDVGLGQLEGRWIAGVLSGSGFFEPDGSTTRRSLGAVAMVFTPDFDPGLSLGFTRAVYRRNEARVPVGAALDVFRNVGRPGAVPGDSMLPEGPEQLFSIFGRWVFPAAGMEAYGEWGRYEQPASLRDLLTAPHHSQGYTLGVQVARAVAAGRVVRLQGEFSNLEPSRTFRVREIRDWYSSRRVPEGYTHHGRVIGAAIGPSGSSQWAAMHLEGERAGAGLFGGRIRWEGLAYAEYPPEFRKADVSLFGGIRGHLDLGTLAVGVEYTSTARLNYLFQAQPTSDIGYRGVDIANHTIRINLGAGSRWF